MLLVPMKVKGFTLFVFLAFSCVAAQDGLPPPASQSLDSLYTAAARGNISLDSLLTGNYTTENKVSSRKFKTNFRNDYKGPEFDYTTVKPRESMWKKFQRKLSEILRSLFGELNPGKSMQVTGIILRIFAIVVTGFLLYFLLRFLISKEGGFFFRKKNSKVEIAGTEIHENIHEINFPETITKHERSGDFRSAVRYRFLLVLKQLSDKNVINWTPEKTNKDYIAEIAESRLKEAFTDLVYIFDYVWYGEFPIDEISYKHFKEKFGAVNI